MREHGYDGFAKICNTLQGLSVHRLHGNVQHRICDYVASHTSTSVGLTWTGSTYRAKLHSVHGAAVNVVIKSTNKWFHAQSMGKVCGGSQMVFVKENIVFGPDRSSDCFSITALPFTSPFKFLY